MAAPQRLTASPTVTQFIAWVVWFAIALAVVELPWLRRAIGDFLVVATLLVSFAALLVFGDVRMECIDDDWSGR